MFKGTRLNRSLSVFKHASRRWAAIPLSNPHEPSASSSRAPPVEEVNVQAVGEQRLLLTSWNIQASPYKTVARSELILDRILEGPRLPDIVFLQEVTSSVRQSLLDNPRVQSAFLTTDAEDNTAFKGVPFATMTLLSNKRFRSPSLAEEEGEGEGGGTGGESKMVLDSVFRMELPSRYDRDALCVGIRAPAAPSTVLRLFNVHLDSLDAQFRRALQMDVLAGLLREPGCSGGIVAGDFNPIHPNDRTLVENHGLVDAWVALHGSTTESDSDEGATWGVGVELEDGRKPGRFDKVVMLGLQPNEIKVLRPGFIDACTPWSDHCGLRCTFTI